MTGKGSRRKGADGERAVRDILRKHGFTAERDGRLAADLAHDVTGYHLEVKRQETLAIPKWLRQAEAESGGNIPVVCFRQNRGVWWGVLPLDRLVKLLAIERAGRRLER